MDDIIPTYEECLALIREEGMLENILEHSLLVMEVALAITDNLIPGTGINRDLVLAGALLHDITKTRALVSHEHHDATGGEYLRNRGFERAARIVEAHVETSLLDLEGPLTESDIVHYADKRVMHSTVVTLAKRAEDILARYGTTEERKNAILARIPLSRYLEKKVQKHCMRPIDAILDGIK